MITFVFDQHIPHGECYILVIKPISSGYYVYSFRGQVQDRYITLRGIVNTKSTCMVENPYGEDIMHNYDYTSVWIIPVNTSNHVVEALKEHIQDNYCSGLHMEQFDINLTQYRCIVYEEYLNLL